MESFMFVRTCYVLRNGKCGISFFDAGLAVVLNTTRSLPRLVGVLILFCLFAFTSGRVLAQETTFAGDAQHTSSYAAPAQNLNTIKWTTNIDFNNTGALTHYGSPLITA